MPKLLTLLRTNLIASTSILWLTALPDPCFSQDMSDLTSKEIRGTDISRQWRSDPRTVTKGPDGKIIFLFGEVQPSIVCAPLQVCDIELQPGESVQDVLIGDTVRWKVDPATSGGPNGQAVHLIVKPSEPGLETSMVVTTSRRTYQIKLKSHWSRYMARVGFAYPDDIKAKLSAIQNRMKAEQLPGAGVPAENLSFRFYLRGQAKWRPTRVYSDGIKTYIQFPASMRNGDAPILFLLAQGEQQIVNYRLKGSLMIVDHLIDRAVLISGVGRSQQKVTIQAGG